LFQQPVVIGAPPEHRDWSEGDQMYFPEIDETARIGAFCTVDSGLKDHTRIGPRTWLMKGVHVGHDAQIGADCEIAPHCSIGGHVRIGDGVRVGQGATFKPFITVGDNARVGMGAVVIRDVPAGMVVVGNPAKAIGFTDETLVANL
jgi:acyl-[acyl carrier protein]--UDP-N-acetylglucosamine O-acyltransferase